MRPIWTKFGRPGSRRKGAVFQQNQRIMVNVSFFATWARIPATRRDRPGDFPFLTD
jgi:hypothetical protein